MKTYKNLSLSRSGNLSELCVENTFLYKYLDGKKGCEIRTEIDFLKQEKKYLYMSNTHWVYYTHIWI